MHLYTYFRSSAAFRVRIALNLKGLDWEAIPVNLRENEQKDTGYIAANPQGLLPALAVEGEILSQSLAILEYLDEVQPDPALLPERSIDRAHVRAMAQVVACEIHPLNNLRVLKYLRGPLGQSEEVTNEWYRYWIKEGFTALEALVRRYGSDTHCFGDVLSLADVCLVPQMWNARRFKTDLNAFPRLCAIDAHLTSMDAFESAKPENQDDYAE
ncbi:MAG: maleylacetoacetate isomerase [Sphingomonadales bacterium]|jgi:maleylacetoacetate isomerase